MIISVHVPKSGGSSTLKVLQEAYGEEGVLSDRVDDPGDPCDLQFQQTDTWMDNRPKKLPSSIKVIHGHFRPVKYELIADAFWFTFLRHPIDNLVSMHRYWCSIPVQPSPLHKIFKKQPLSVTDFAKLETFRYLYTRTYFGGWDMGKMNFVGSHENRSDDLNELGSMLGISFDTSIYVNKTKSLSGVEKLDSAVLDKLTNILRDDIAFYERYTK